MTLQQALDAMIAALQPVVDEIPGLQVGFWRPNPTPPSIAIYPGDPFQEGSAFGLGEKRVYWTVRAVVSNVDPAAGPELLLRLLDTNDPASVEAALDTCDAVIGNEDTVSGLRNYTDVGPDLVGAEWRVEMFV